MIEVELKAVVPDSSAFLEHLAQLGARETFVGRLEDRRYDTRENALLGRNETLRVRTYRAPPGPPSVSLDWKGPVQMIDGYKQREELSVGVAEPEALMTVLGKLGYQLSMAIDRDIWQYELDGASIRVERYPRMDVLVEVEGEPAAIESAIKRLGIARTEYTSETLPAFVSRFERRTGTSALLAGFTD